MTSCLFTCVFSCVVCNGLQYSESIIRKAYTTNEVVTNTVISGSLPARQITRTGRFLPKWEKRFSRLPALADNPHQKTKESYAK